jgi:CheY-like chemotaxis protein
MNLLVFKSLLKQTLIQVDVAEDGNTGLASTRKKKYDIIFLDHMMPGKDGIETLKELKAESVNPNLETPVICLTANAISGAREEYISAGFDDYLTKPIDSEHLENMLIKYLPKELIEGAKETPAKSTAASPSEKRILEEFCAHYRRSRIRRRGATFGKRRKSRGYRLYLQPPRCLYAGICRT